MTRADINSCGIGETLGQDRRAEKAAIRRPYPATGGIRVSFQRSQLDFEYLIRVIGLQAAKCGTTCGKVVSRIEKL